MASKFPGIDGGMIVAWGIRNTWRRTCPSATLPTMNPTWTGAVSNLGLRGVRPPSSFTSFETNFSILPSEFDIA